MPRHQGRRNNQEGTIYRRSDGRWEARLPPEISRDGTIRRPAFYGRTKAEAQEKLKAALREADKGTSHDAFRITLGAYIEEWLAHRADDLKPNTLHAYRYALAHAVSIFDVPLAKVDPRVIKGLLTRLRREGVSAKSCARLHSKLYSVMKEAVADGILASNVMDRVRTPRAERATTEVWTRTELLTFLGAIPEDDAAYALFYVAAFTGMRRGELLGLRWQDFDIEVDGTGTLHVNQAVVATQGNGFAITTPKTRASLRSVAVTHDVVAVLQKHRARLEALRKIRGDLWYGAPAIFPSEVGTYRDPRNTDRMFKRWIRTAGVKEIRFHDLRHTHASILIANGVDPGVVSDRLGHTQVAFTMSTYRHLYERQRRRSAFGIQALIQAELAADGLAEPSPTGQMTAQEAGR